MPTPSEIDALPDYTTAQKIKLFEYAQLSGWGSTSRTIDGRTVTFPSPMEIEKLLDKWRSDLAQDDDSTENGGTALAVFGRPT